jgi:ketosteroid isomerase-like protein
MDSNAVANAFAALLIAGKTEEAGAQFWSDDVVSIEPMGEMLVSTGIEAVRAKSEWWAANHDIHAFTAEGPYVHGDQFIMRFFVDVTTKADGQRMAMHEMGLYTVKGSKIVEERFFFAPMPGMA